MKSRNILARKLEHFYRDIQPKIEKIAKNERMRLQTDSEFWQSEIKKLNQNYNIEILEVVYAEHRVYAAEQKLENSKNFLFRIKRLHKAATTKRFNLKKLINKAIENINSTRSQKYGYVLHTIEEKTAESQKFRDVYHFYRLVKVK